MATSEEGREEPPSPEEIITSFEEAHASLISSGLGVKAMPSHSRFNEFNGFVETASVRLNPFFEQNFFTGLDNKIVVGSAVYSVKHAAEELAATITRVNPKFEPSFKFGEDIVEVMMDESDDPEIKTRIQNISKELCSFYIEMAQSLGSAIVNTEEFKAFLANEERNRQRMANVRQIAITALAAFAGTYLANKSQKRN